MATNRILQHLRCDCRRKRLRQQELDSIAEHLDSLCGEPMKVESFDLEIHLTILGGWQIENVDQAGSEIADQLRETAGQLTAAAERIGGAL